MRCTSSSLRVSDMDGSAFKGLWVGAAAIGTFGAVVIFALGFLVGRCG